MNIFNRFIPKHPLEGGKQALSVTRGTCVFDNYTYECVEKIYDNKESFDKAVEAYRFLETKEDMKTLFPEVYHVDEDKLSIKMAYFHCTTIANFFETTDIYDEENYWMINGILLSLNDMLDTLIRNKVTHGDLNATNVLVCSSVNRPMVDLKVIDIDSVSKMNENDFDDNDTYNDSYRLSVDIRGYIGDNVKKGYDTIRFNAGILSNDIKEEYRKKKISRDIRNKKQEELEEKINLSTKKVDERKSASSINKRLESFSNCGKFSMRIENGNKYDIPDPSGE